MPEPTAPLIKDLLDMISRGEVKLPKFQRPFVWTQEKVLALLDSVYQGYPIGTLLLWETHTKLPEENNLGGFSFPDAPALTPRKYVLDGQQRLVSLLGSLRLHTATSEHFPVYFDLKDKKFTTVKDDDSPYKFPLYNLFEILPYVKHVQTLQLLEDGEEFVKVLTDLLDRFQSYKVSVVTIHEPDITRVAPIFERINSTGTRLTLFDFLVAALWSPEFDFRGRVEAIRSALEPKRFEEIDEVTVIRAMSVVALGTANRATLMSDLRDRSHDQLNKDLDTTSGALAKAVDFLSTQVSIIGDEMLPYERQLVLLTFVFAKNLVKDAASRRILRQWFWRTSFSERYRRGGEGLFDEDLEAASAALGNAELLDRFGAPPQAGALMSSEFRIPSALTKAFAAMLACEAPRNLWSGDKIDVVKALSPYNRREFHHIFPKAFVAKKLNSHPRANSLINICMLTAEDNKLIGDRAPSDYIAELKTKHGSQFEAILASNLISGEALEHLEKDDFDGFLLTRSGHIRNHIMKLLYET